MSRWSEWYDWRITRPQPGYIVCLLITPYNFSLTSNTQEGMLLGYDKLNRPIMSPAINFDETSEYVRAWMVRYPQAMINLKKIAANVSV